MQGVSQQRPLFPADQEDLTVDGSVRRPDAAKAAAASGGAYLQLEAGPIRFTVSGIDPTVSTGLFGYDGREEMLTQQELLRFAAIRDDVTNGIARLTYYARK